MLGSVLNTLFTWYSFQLIAASETAKEGRKLVSFMTPHVTALECVCHAQKQQNKCLKTAAAVVRTSCCVLGLLALVTDISFVMREADYCS